MIGILTFYHTFAACFREVAQPGSALVWGARGRWFESSLPDNDPVNEVIVRNYLVLFVIVAFFSSKQRLKASGNKEDNHS